MCRKMFLVLIMLLNKTSRLQSNVQSILLIIHLHVCAYIHTYVYLLYMHFYTYYTQFIYIKLKYVFKEKRGKMIFTCPAKWTKSTSFRKGIGNDIWFTPLSFSVMTWLMRNNNQHVKYFCVQDKKQMFICCIKHISMCPGKCKAKHCI